MPRLLRIMRTFDHSVEVDILIFAKRSKRASRFRFRHAKAMKSSAGVSLTRTHPARKETAAPGCTRVPSRRCFLARIGIQYGVADNNAQFYTGQDWRPYTSPSSTDERVGGRDEIRLEVSKPAPEARERAYVCEKGHGGKKEKESAREMAALRSDMNRTERTYLLYVAHRWRRTCTCSVQVHTSFLGRLHPCVKFLRGFLPSSSRSWITAALPLILPFYLPLPRPVLGRRETTAPNPVASLVAATSMAVQQLGRSLILSPDAGQVLISSRPRHPHPFLPLCAFRVRIMAKKRAIEQARWIRTAIAMNCYCWVDTALSWIVLKSLLSRGSYKR